MNAAILPLALLLSAAPPAEVKLYFRAAPPAERVVVGEVVITPDDLKPGVAVDDDSLLRALRVEAARGDADVVLKVTLAQDAAGRPVVRGVLARDGKPRHGVRARSGVVLFFHGEGMPPRGERVRDLEVGAGELPSGTRPSRAALICTLATKGQAIGADAVALVEVVEGKERLARGVAVRKPVRPATTRPRKEVVGKGVAVDEGWFDVPPSKTPPPKLEGDAPPDPVDR